MLASPLSTFHSICVDLVDDLSGDCGSRVVGVVVAAIVGGIAIDAGEVIDCVDAESGLQECQICRIEFDFVENRADDYFVVSVVLVQECGNFGEHLCLLCAD